MSWINVGAPDRVREGAGIVVNRGEVSLAVFRWQGQFYALDNECPHQGGPLGMGRVEDGCAVCPLHEWKFDLRTGRMPLLPIGVRTYRIELRDDGLYVEVPDAPSP